MPAARRLSERLLRVHQAAALQRSVANAKLLERIRHHHAASDGSYGAVRVREDLLEERPADRVGRHRVARLMRENGLAGVTRRRGFKTTRRGEIGEHASDLVDRDFGADGPDQLWVADITYVPTWAGFLYLAVVLDAWSRRIVGCPCRWPASRGRTRARPRRARRRGSVGSRPRSAATESRD